MHYFDNIFLAFEEGISLFMKKGKKKALKCFNALADDPKVDYAAKSLLKSSVFMYGSSRRKMRIQFDNAQNKEVMSTQIYFFPRENGITSEIQDTVSIKNSYIWVN